MTTPLIPEISVTNTPAKLGVCNCCGVDAEDGSVKHVKFSWRDTNAKRLAGGTAVALCPSCRRKAAIALVESL